MNSVNGSELYQRVITYFDKDEERDELSREVWSGTPWMVDAYTGKIENFGRYREIMDWCREQFGPEAWPIHGKPGSWHCGGATVMGWTWMGFATEDMMNQFIERWPSPVDATLED